MSPLSEAVQTLGKGEDTETRERAIWALDPSKCQSLEETTYNFVVGHSEDAPQNGYKNHTSTAVFLLMPIMKDKPSSPLSLPESYYSASYQLNIIWKHTMERNVGCSGSQAFLKVQTRRNRGSNSMELTTASLAKGIGIDQWPIYNATRQT